jgi:hypothetical protein
MVARSWWQLQLAQIRQDPLGIERAAAQMVADELAQQ